MTISRRISRQEQGGEDEPTQYLPNVGVTRTRSQSYRPPVQEPEEEEEEERPRSNWWKVLLLIVVLAAAGYFAVTTLFKFVMDSLTPTVIEYTVPNVVGHTLEEAKELEGIKGIFSIVEDEYENSSEYPEGTIIDQILPRGASGG